MSNLIENNAYRILGLDVVASQTDVIRRYKEIINRLKIEDYPTYDIDINLPKDYRNEESVKRALKALQSQKDNIKEYFFWFQISNSNDKKALNYMIENEFSKAIRIWNDLAKGDSVVSIFYKKNLAVLYCLLLLKKDNPKYLKDSLSMWDDVVKSEKFWVEFSKRYIDQNKQTISQENVLSFKEIVVKEISDIYTDLGREHKNSVYIRSFQEIFGTHGERTEKDLLQPVYQTINEKIAELQKIRIAEVDKQVTNGMEDEDKCANCGVTEAEEFFEYKDKSFLCDVCYKKIGQKHFKDVEKLLQESNVGADEYKWRKTVIKIYSIINAIQDNLHDLQKNGLYNDAQSKVVRDHVAEAIRAKAVDLCNYGSLYEESEKLARIASKISGTESYKGVLENEKGQLEKIIKDDKNSLLTIDFPGFFSSKQADFKRRFAEYDGKKVFYKDVTEISFSGAKRNYSTTYYFWINSHEGSISFSFSSAEAWNKLTSLCFQWVIPLIVKRYVDMIFEKNEIVNIGDIGFSKNGFARPKFWGGNSFVSWDEKIYIPRFLAGNVVLYEDDAGKVKSFASIPMATANAVILPSLLQGCVDRAVALGLIHVKTAPTPSAQGVQFGENSDKPPAGFKTWDEYYDKMDKEQQEEYDRIEKEQKPYLFKAFVKSGGEKIPKIWIDTLKTIREKNINEDTAHNINKDILRQLVTNGYVREIKGISSTGYVIEEKGFNILNWILTYK
jgi:hypothetical protein